MHCEIEVQTVSDGPYADSINCGRYSDDLCPQCGLQVCAAHIVECCGERMCAACYTMHDCRMVNAQDYKNLWRGLRNATLIMLPVYAAVIWWIR